MRCIILSINHLLLPQSYLLNGSLNNADWPEHWTCVYGDVGVQVQCNDIEPTSGQMVPSYTSSIRQRAITGTHATRQTCRWCLTIFRVESASIIQGTYELLLFVHCSTLKSVTSHKSKSKEIHLQLFMDFNVEQCRVM